MKKRILSMLLVLAMVLSLATTALAAPASAKVSLTADKTALKAGESITLTLTVSEEMTDITNLQYNLFFDTALFALTDSANGVANTATQISNLLTDNTGIQSGYTRKGQQYYMVSFVDVYSNGQVINPGTLYSLTFTAKEDITEAAEADFWCYHRSTMDTTFKQVAGGEMDGDTVNVTVSPAAIADSYSVSLSPAAQSVNYGATANVAVSVGANGYTKFNAVDMTLGYDAGKLTFDKSASTGLDGYTVTEQSGSIRIQGFGEDKALGTAFSLAFTANGTGDAQVTVRSARIDDDANANLQNAPEASVENGVAVIQVSGYAVTLPEDFTGESVALPGEDYTFTEKDSNYDYDITATVDGKEVPVVDNGDGTYTIKAENITGNIVITAVKTAKTHSVTVDGTGKDDVTAISPAVYGEDYSFTVREASGYTYEVAVAIGGTAYTGYSAENGVYTIPGADITGEIVITVTKTAIPPQTTTVSFEGTGAGEVEGDATAVIGSDYTFKVNKTAGYDYEVTATVNGEDVTVTDNGDGTYTIAGKDVTGPIVITVAKTGSWTVAVNEYVKLDGKTMFLVTVAGTPGEGKDFTYGGTPMYYSEQYKAYCYLVIAAEAFNEEAAAEQIGLAAAAAETVTYDNDVNETGLVDINDAQLVYNMYNAKYEDFAAVSMLRFLKADVNGSKTLNVEDAAAVVNAIQ